MINIFLNKNDIKTFVFEDVDGEITTGYFLLEEFTMSKFNNIKSPIFNECNILVPLKRLGYNDKIIQEWGKDYRLYKDCKIVCIEKNEVIFKFPSYFYDDVNIVVYRKEKIKKILDD